ncbi:MAG: alpha/beta hydrolase [Acidobacteria bacterium]|nr:alpha/beta hydrolase [Acidobacteriota bacterium]
MLWWILILVCIVGTSVAGVLIHRKLRQSFLTQELRVISPLGIEEERFISIGGIEQWISIRGEDRLNPVLFLIHGGPGSSYAMFAPHLKAWERHFTIVQWDQRGAGKTFSRMGPGGCGEISMRRLTLDAIELAENLRTYLQKERLFLLASSFGSTFGVQVAQSRPDLFYAYIGTDQNVGMVRGRVENHHQLLERLRTMGMIEGSNLVERIGGDMNVWTPRDFKTVMHWTMKSDPKGFRQTVKLLRDSVWFAPGWTLNDIYAFVKGMDFSLRDLLPEIVRYDAWKQSTRFHLPVFIFQGEDDVVTLTAQAQSYFAEIHAPAKYMELIPNAGHFAMFLQPRVFLEKLLANVRPLADVQ